MKEQLEHPQELNPPPELLVRATIALAVGAFACGVLLTVAGVVVAQAHLSALGLMTLLLAWGAHCWLQRKRAHASADQAISRIWEDTPRLDDSRATELMTLLEQWEALEAKRGSQDFDPWALQSLRNDIRRVVESDPGFEELFDRLRQAA